MPGGCTEGPTGIQALGGSPMGKLLEIHIVLVSRVGIYGKDIGFGWRRFACPINVTLDRQKK